MNAHWIVALVVGAVGCVVMLVTAIARKLKAEARYEELYEAKVAWFRQNNVCMECKGKGVIQEYTMGADCIGGSGSAVYWPGNEKTCWMCKGTGTFSGEC